MVLLNPSNAFFKGVAFFNTAALVVVGSPSISSASNIEVGLMMKCVPDLSLRRDGSPEIGVDILWIELELIQLVN